MVDVITGYSRESQDLLGWAPETQKIIDCNCEGGVMPIKYGTSLGYYCPIRNVQGIKDTCGPNIVCADSMGMNILTFCPDGFVPSCEMGCALPWKKKDEL